uniref:Ribosomal RNA-processing protein 12-like conserved domain-containing protein n=3 Tax=Trichobilharzia regenti TaxID=157069 RepID=A0AA85KD90_TRIRE|nr:unnamed protein product [Trichobilharzia regenti]
MPSTVSVTSFSSWASNATKCTNPAFRNALNRAWSNVSMQKDVLSVLAAVTKTIKDNGGKESPAEYYAVLLTLISESPEKVAPAYLLKLLMCKAVQDSLLRKTCGEAAKTLMSLLNPRSESSNPTLIKSVLTCLGRLLRAQSYDSWSADSVRHIYRHVLRFVDNEKPSIRKASHLAIVDILSSFNVVSLTEEVNFHPACHQTQEHLSAVIREETRQLITSLHTKDVQCTRLLHCLDLLTSVIPLLPSKDVKLACECILELSNFPNPLVVTKMFHSFKTMFDSKPSLKTLPIDIAARLITALYSCRPNDPNVFTLSDTNNNTSCTGVDAIISWIQALISGCTYLSGLSIMATESDDAELKQKIGNIGRFTIQQLASEHLDRLIKTLMSLLTSTPIPQLREATTQKLNQLFMDVADPQITSCQLTEILPGFISHVLSGFINSLQYTHYEIWHHLLSLIERFIMIFSKVYVSASMTDSTALMELLKVILHLRDCLADGPKGLISLIHVDPSSFSLMGLDDLGEKIIDGLDSVCLITIEYLGPELLSSESVFSLETLVKELEAGSIDLRRSWFLPLLSRAVPQKPCALSIFSKQILPLADRGLSVASSTAAMSDKTKPANNALITLGIKVACQLWSALNMFVHRSPTDWSELSTGGLGSRLVKEFNSAPALRPIILHAFRRLAKLAAGDDSATTIMRGGAKMALPAMLSLYETLDTTTQYSMKQKIQATLSYYLPIMSSKIICSVTKTAMNKFDNTNQPIYLEIFHIIAPYNSVSDLEVIVARINDYLTLEQLSKPLKKRACRVLESICSGVTSQTDEFLTSNLDNIILLVCGLTKRLVNKSSEKSTATVTTTAPTSVAETLTTTINNDDNTESIEKKMTKLSVCGIKLDQSSNKTAKYFIPWKPLLQCIHHLFKRLVTCELNTANRMNSDETMDKGDLMENERLKKFANMFFPEILTCMLDLNRTIRDLAGRLLIGLVNAFAGQQPFDKNINSLSLLYGSRNNLNFDANSSRPPTIMKGIMKDSDSEDDDNDNGNESGRQDGKSAMSLGGLTCSDDDDDDDIVSTKSMQRGSVISERICRALNLVLSRLWPCLPPHNRSAENSIDLALQQSSARAICLLMKHTRFRQALVLNIDSESEEICQLVSIILSEMNLISQNLVKSPQRVLIRLGLQLSRSLIAFIQEGCISLASVLETLQSIHPTCKRPLRFVVKSILEKMIKKFGRQAIQGLLNSEHQKIVRNSAKLIARRERKSKALEKSTSKSTALSSVSSSIIGSVHQQLSDSDSDHNSRKSLINDTKSIVSSIRSKSSRLPKRVHITRMDELLASSSDDDDNEKNNFPGNKSQSDRSSLHSQAKSIRSKTKSHDGLSSSKNHPMSLVEELENVKQTAGLCRRSRKNIIQSGSLEDFDMDIDIDSSEDDEAIDKALCKHPLRAKHQVRFADTISRASTTRSHLSRRSQKAQQLASSTLHHQAVTDSDLWLVENPNDSEILDLSDPKSLARHTAFAPDDITAKAMVNAFRNSLVQQSSSEVVGRAQPFPIVNGKIVIGNPVDENQLVNKKDNSEWALSDDDNNDDSSLPATSHYQQGKLMKNKKQKTLQIPGRVYASTKAKGDMKRRGMPEPYAFVPLGAGIGKSADTLSQKITPLERRRLLREVGLGRQKRKRIQGAVKA